MLCIVLILWENWDIFKKGYFFFGTLSQTLHLEKFCNDMSTIISVNNLVQLMAITLSVQLCVKYDGHDAVDYMDPPVPAETCSACSFDSLMPYALHISDVTIDTCFTEVHIISSNVFTGLYWVFSAAYNPVLRPYILWCRSSCAEQTVFGYACFNSISLVFICESRPSCTISAFSSIGTFCVTM